MARSIRITADTTQLKKSITDLSKMVNKDMGKSRIELFTPDTKKFLRSEAAQQVSNLKKKIDGIKESTQGHLKALKAVVKGSDEEYKIKMKILKASKAVVEAEQDHQEAIRATASLQQSAFQKQFAKMSGISTIMEKMRGFGGEGGGMMGMAGGLLGAGSLAALAYGGSRVYAGRQTWKQGVSDRLALQARTGTSNLEPENPQAMERAGLDAQSMRAARLQSMDVFGAGRATEKSVVQRAGFERAYGVEQGTMTGIGAALRPSMGGAQANATVMKLQASLIASGIKDAIGPYLETAASMLTELNDKGFTMDDEVMSLFNQMIKGGTLGEGKAKELSMGVDQAIRGSTGESNAFLQSVFKKAGIGGTSIGGIQAAMQMGGLFGADLSKYKGNITDKAEGLNQSLGLGKSNYMQKVSGSLLTMLKQSTGGLKGNQALLSKYRFMQNLGLAKNIGQAEMVENMLQLAANPKTSAKSRESIQKQLQNIQDENKDPSLSELKKINSSTAGIYDVLQKTNQTQLDQLGQVTGGVFNDMDKLLTSIDGAILSIAKTLTGYMTPQEMDAKIQKSAKFAEESAKKGVMTANPEDLKKLPFEEQMDLYRDIKQKADTESQRGFFKNSSYQNLLDSGVLNQAGRQVKHDEDLKSKLKTLDPASAQYKRIADYLENISKHTKNTAQNTKVGGGLPAASSDTTGIGQR